MLSWPIVPDAHMRPSPKNRSFESLKTHSKRTLTTFPSHFNFPFLIPNLVTSFRKPQPPSYSRSAWITYWCKKHKRSLSFALITSDLFPQCSYPGSNSRLCLIYAVLLKSPKGHPFHSVSVTKFKIKIISFQNPQPSSNSRSDCIMLVNLWSYLMYSISTT